MPVPPLATAMTGTEQDPDPQEYHRLPEVSFNTLTRHKYPPRCFRK
jgi:hypothetical protein